MSEDIGGIKGEPPKATVNLDHDRVVCDVHGEPFRRYWPTGYAIFVVRGFELLAAHEFFQREAKRSVEGINECLSRLPICCRLPRAELVALYLEVNGKTSQWPDDRCHMCDEYAVGTPVECKAGGKQLTLPHVCFECIAKKRFLK